MRERSGIIRNAFCIRWTNDRTIHRSLSLTFNNNVSSLFIAWRYDVSSARFAIVLTKPLHYTLFYPADRSLLRFFPRQSLSLFSICRFFMPLPFYRFYYAFFFIWFYSFLFFDLHSSAMCTNHLSNERVKLWNTIDVVEFFRI